MYKKHWVIENNAFKKLSEHWNLTKKPGGKFNTICCHLYFTLAAYNLVLLFKTKYAKKLMGRTMNDYDAAKQALQHGRVSRRLCARLLWVVHVGRIVEAAGQSAAVRFMPYCVIITLTCLAYRYAF
jgi:hypothetical protein